MSQNAFVTSSAIDCDIIGRMLIKLVRYRVIVWRSAFISSFMDVEPCNKQNNVCSLMIICLYPHLSVIFGVYFLCCFATPETNTKMTLSWVHWQFTTRVHTLLYIYISSYTMTSQLGKCLEYSHLHNKPTLISGERNSSPMQMQYLWKSFNNMKNFTW